MLLLIPGGPADSRGIAELRDVLSDRYGIGSQPAALAQRLHDVLSAH